jgi:hypothetical protein
MAEANRSVHQHHAKIRASIGGAIVTLARQRAVKEVKREFWGQGLKCNQMAHREVVAAANNYMAIHPELVAEAKKTVDQWLAEGFFGKRAQRAWAQRASLERFAQNAKA